MPIRAACVVTQRARRVLLFANAGSWNNWAKGYALHRQHPGQDYCVVVPMKPGNYEVRNLERAWQRVPLAGAATCC